MAYLGPFVCHKLLLVLTFSLISHWFLLLPLFKSKKQCWQRLVMHDKQINFVPVGKVFIQTSHMFNKFFSDTNIFNHIWLEVRVSTPINKQASPSLLHGIPLQSFIAILYIMTRVYIEKHVGALLQT